MRAVFDQHFHAFADRISIFIGIESLKYTAILLFLLIKSRTPVTLVMGGSMELKEVANCQELKSKLAMSQLINKKGKRNVPDAMKKRK